MGAGLRVPLLVATLGLLLGFACTREGERSATAPRDSMASGPNTRQHDQPDPPKAETVVVFFTESGEVRAAVEVVSTYAKIQQGLMYRRHMAPDRGMLFVFGSDKVRSFWMKNTLISLDMLFVRADMSVAGVERDTVPLSEESRSVGIKTRYVIEVNAGWTAKHGIEAGTIVRFENLPAIQNPPP